MEKKKLGIDLDTTLNNLNEVWLERYNQDYGDNLTEWIGWDIHNHIKSECGHKIYNYLKEPDFFYNLDIRENAAEVIDYLLEYFEIYIPSAYVAEACLDKVKWINKYLPNIKTENIIFINDKSLLELDYLIDDGPHNIQTFSPFKDAIIYDMPYNRYLDHDGFQTWPRIKNWLEIKELFENEYINK